MLRIALIDILLFALPFILYAAYMVAVRGIAPAELWQGAPVFWLLAAGCGLLVVVLATPPSALQRSHRSKTRNG